MKRKESPVKIAAFSAFYRIQRLCVGSTMPLDAGIFSLLDRAVVRSLLAMPEPLNAEFLNCPFGLSTILYFGGVQMVSVGILWEYVGRIYDEVKRRPLYIVDETIGAKPEAC